MKLMNVEVTLSAHLRPAVVNGVTVDGQKISVMTSVSLTVTMK